MFICKKYLLHFYFKCRFSVKKIMYFDYDVIGLQLGLSNVDRICLQFTNGMFILYDNRLVDFVGIRLTFLLFFLSGCRGG